MKTFPESSSLGITDYDCYILFRKAFTIGKNQNLFMKAYHEGRDSGSTMVKK
jgi:hypothetical protein